MTFRTTLFRALQAADVVTCNGEPVDVIVLDASLLPPYVQARGGAVIRITDDEIAIDAQGRAYTAAPGGEALVWTFQALQPLTPAHVPTFEAPAPTVTRLHDVLRQSARR